MENQNKAREFYLMVSSKSKYIFFFTGGLNCLISVFLDGLCCYTFFFFR